MPKATVVKPHGTPQRYWQGCRCQPCKTAVNEHLKRKKREKAGFEPPSAKAKAAPPPAPRPAARPKALARRAVEAVVVPADSTEFQSLATEIWSLTKQLRAAEAKYAKAANEFLRNYKVVPVEAAAGQEN